MYRVFLAILLLIGFVFFNNQVFSYENCDGYKRQCDYDKRQYEIYGYGRSNSYVSSCREYQDCIYRQEMQHEEAFELNNKGLDYYNNGMYEKALVNFQKALDIVGSKIEENYEIVQGNIILCYNKLADLAFEKGNLEQSINYYDKALKLDAKDVDSLFGLGYVNFKQENYTKALDIFKKAYDYSTNYDLIEALDFYIAYIEFMLDEEEKQKNSVTNDFFSYRSLPYLEMHNIIEAWKNVKQAESQEVIIAIIDDGVYVNHPDLSSNVWVNRKEIPNDRKDNDKNGYKDDYNGWNFVYNNNLLPLGTHGTMIAGIIGAIRDNKEGIAGIVKNVKIMPIGVCDFGDSGGCKDYDVIKGINYAIDNGANIINLSLGGNQFNFTNEYNKAIKRAYDKGVIVVVAAGNGDVVIDLKNGINTTINPLSPVCNCGNNNKRIIGVGALNLSGERIRRSNYGECVSFWALGEEIFSTVIPEEDTGKNIYNFGDMAYDFGLGTSFSAPIIAGIVGLGYNKYGYIHPNIVRDSLFESMGTGYIVDANKYLDILGKKISEGVDIKNKTGLTKLENIYNNLSDLIYKIEKRFYVFIQSFKKSDNIIDSIKSLNFNN